LFGQKPLCPPTPSSLMSDLLNTQNRNQRAKEKYNKKHSDQFKWTRRCPIFGGEAFKGQHEVGKLYLNNRAPKGIYPVQQSSGINGDFKSLPTHF